MTMTNGAQPQRNTYPEFVSGLTRLIKDVHVAQENTNLYFYLQNQILLELGNLACDVAESIVRHTHFDPVALRQRMDVLNNLIEQAPAPQVLSSVQYPTQQPQHGVNGGYQQPGYQMRDVLDRAGHEPRYDDGNGYDHGSYPHPQQFAR